MRPNAIARRYARALFALAEQQGTLDQVDAALGTTVDALSDPNVMRILTGPVTRERKRGLLGRIVDAAGAPPLVRDFLLLVAEHDRLKHAPAIRGVFAAMVDAKHGVTRATIKSAAPLSPDMVEEASRVFGSITGRKVVAKVDVIPDLIAGMIVEIEGRVYDGSLRTELDKLHQQMAAGS
jgi:F-type H+-transporting ATPase subunit delta